MSAYTIFDPFVDKPLHELKRDDALKAFEWFMSQREIRLHELQSLLKDDSIELDFTEDSLNELDNWFVQKVRAEGPSGEPSSFVFSICNDIGIYVSETMIRARPKLHWHFYTANRKDIAYQRPVIMGFSVSNKNYNIDCDYLLCQYAFRLLKGGENEDNMLTSIYEYGVNHT